MINQPGALNLPPSVPYTRYVLMMIFLVSVFNTCDRTIISMLADDIKGDLGFSDRQMGILLGLGFSVTYFLAGLPLSRLADRWSRPKVVALALMTWSGMTIVSGMASSFFTMLIARMGVGLGEAGGSPPSSALISEYVPLQKRARAMTTLSLGALCGLGVGVIFGGWASAAIGWRMALIVVGIPGVVLGILFFTTIRDYRSGAAPLPETRDSTGADKDGFLHDLIGLFRIRSFFLLVAAACTINVMVMAAAMWMPTLLRRVYEMEATEAGLWHFAITIIPSGLGMFLGATVADRLSQRDVRWICWVPAIASLMAVPLAYAFLLLDSTWLIGGLVPLPFVFAFLMAAMLGAWSPIAMSMAQSLVPANDRSMAAAAWSMLAALIGGGLGPYLVGELSTQFNPRFGDEGIRYALAILAVFPLLAAALFAAIAKSIKRDMDLTRA